MQDTMKFSEKLFAVKKETDKRINYLCSLKNEGELRAIMAKLRKGIGYKPGEVPELWALFLDNLPGYMMSKSGIPTYEEWAIYSSITLFALHQQGHDMVKEPMHHEGVSLGQAAKDLVLADEDRIDSITRRFNLVATAPDIQEMNYYLRNFIQLLRADNIGLDYSILAQDLFRYQYSDMAASVRLGWGQDFYSRKNEKSENKTEEDNFNE